MQSWNFWPGVDECRSSKSSQLWLLGMQLKSANPHQIAPLLSHGEYVLALWQISRVRSALMHGGIDLGYNAKNKWGSCIDVAALVVWWFLWQMRTQNWWFWMWGMGIQHVSNPQESWIVDSNLSLSSHMLCSCLGQHCWSVWEDQLPFSDLHMYHIHLIEYIYISYIICNMYIVCTFICIVCIVYTYCARALLCVSRPRGASNGPEVQCNKRDSLTASNDSTEKEEATTQTTHVWFSIFSMSPLSTPYGHENPFRKCFIMSVAPSSLMFLIFL